MTLRAYAKHRKNLGLPGGAHESVRRAIASGRLDHSLARDKHGNITGIADAVAADREWLSNTAARTIAGPPAPRPTVALEDYEAEAELSLALAKHVVTSEPGPVTVETTDGIAQRIAAEVGLTEEQTDSLADLFHFALERMADPENPRSKQEHRDRHPIPH